jgi:hypothetical protein
MKDTEIVPYFAEKEEQAVFDYINSNSAEEKNRIYNKILLKPFRIMNESILRKFPIYIGNYTMEQVEEEALTHLIEHMIKYRPFIIELNKYDTDKWSKLGDDCRFWYSEDAQKKLKSLLETDTVNNYRIFNSKAYSYCQTIIRNFYKDWGKKTYTEKKINLSYDDYVDEINENIEYSYEMEMETHHQLDKLIKTVIEKIEVKINTDATIKKNEVIVGDAIVNVLKNWHVLFMEDTPDGKFNKRITNKFAKNKILFFLKEQTALSTKEIRIGIKPFKDIYFMEKIDYLDD